MVTVAPIVVSTPVFSLVFLPEWPMVARLFLWVLVVFLLVVMVGLRLLIMVTVQRFIMFTHKVLPRKWVIPLFKETWPAVLIVVVG